MDRRPPLGVLALAALLHAPVLLAQAPRALPTGPPAAAAAAAATITASDLRRRLAVIAADSMRGRATPSPELEQTAAWIASEFARFGLRPGGDEGSYLQRYAIRTSVLEPAASIASFGDATLRFGRDVAPAYAYLLPQGERSGPLVVISGTGLAGAALLNASFAGRHVLIVPPRGSEPRTPAVAAVLRAVLAAGPFGVWLASDRADADWAARGNVELRRRHPSIGDPELLPALVVRDRAVEAVLAGAGVRLAELRERARQRVRVDLVPGLRVTLDARTRLVEESFAPNVVGILPGSDPARSGEYVVFSAHMDHVGIGVADAAGDSVYNGADDDGSGTSTVVELAEAFATLEPRPARSMIFLTVSGEERGLWGSDWFTAHPPVPIERLVADLNIDMIGRNWTDTIVAIGREHSDLGATLARVNRAHPELKMTAIDDPWPAESFYTRSDHFNFARRGVPVLFFFSGTHADYHKPSDEVAKIDADKTARIGRLLFYLGLEVASASAPPRWDPASFLAIVGR
ncbi:MAG: M28 family peptidase [Gemmatimonadetes bacterium]|nr:M28 family peptidase [Gemmatimonadota bacterium]